MKASERLDLENIIITSRVASAITYSLMYAYRVIVLIYAVPVSLEHPAA
jgi:hypothetical protein